MMQNPAGPGGFTKPTVRNAMIGLAPLILWIAGSALGGAIGQAASAISLVGTILHIVLLIKMVGELNAVTGGSLPWWPMFIPCYNLYWAFSMLPAEVKKAKERAGSKTAVRGAAAYFFVTPYALASDLNDIAQGS